MKDIKFVFAGEDTELQRNSVPMLARCFEEWQIFQAENGNRFTFREISFVALDKNDEIVGHVGIMPFDVLDGNNNVIRMAGIASVGTDPDFRGRGIAAKLCRMAAEWADDNGFDCLPLYTSFNRVYESCGWKNYPMRSISLTNRDCKKKKARKGCELSSTEKAFVMNCYERMGEFAGKVIRSNDNSFHGWDRIFNEIFFDWYVEKNGYAVAFEGVLAEFFAVDGNASDIVAGIEKAFLPEKFAGVGSLLDGDWQVSAVNTAPDCWHGENVMTCSLRKIKSELFYSLTDKF